MRLGYYLKENYNLLLQTPSRLRLNVGVRASAFLLITPDALRSRQ